MAQVGRKLITAALTVAGIATAGAVSGCGATRAVSGAVDPVAQAATTTAHASGYRMSATIDAVGPAGTVHGTMAGAFDTSRHAGLQPRARSVRAGRTDHAEQ